MNKQSLPVFSFLNGVVDDFDVALKLLVTLDSWVVNVGDCSQIFLLCSIKV